MSLGSRTCTTIKAVTLCAKKTQLPSREPLLFLYPRWFSSTDNSQTFSSKRVLGRPSHQSIRKPEHQYGQSAGRRRSSNKASEAISPTRVSKSSDEPPSSFDTNDAEDDYHTITSHLGPEPTEQEIAGFTNRTPTGGQTDGDWEKAASEVFEARKHAHYTTEAEFVPVRPLDEIGPWSNETFRQVLSSAGRTTLRHGSTPLIHRLADRQRIRLDKRLANQVLKDRGTLSSDWRIPLKMLLANHSAHSKAVVEKDAEQIFLPEQVLAKLVGSVREGSWRVNLRSSCDIRILPKSESRGLMRRVLLRGSPLSIDVTKDYIAATWAEVAASHPKFFENVPFLPQPSSLGSPEEEDEPLIRSAWADFGGPDDNRSLIRADDIPRPVDWSVKTFADYIERITAQYLPRGMHRNLYDGLMQHVDVVEKIIRELYKNPKNKQYFSTRALNLAIAFLYRYRFLPTARFLCMKFDEANGNFVTESFNIMLQGAAKQNDLFSYTYSLALMVRQGLKADARAWVALLHTIESQDVRLVIYRYMKRAGLLDDPTIVTQAVATLVKDSFASHIDDDSNLQSYLQLMDDNYGEAWFGINAGNKILSALAQRGRLDGMPEVINLFHERDVPMNDASLAIILMACRDLQAIGFAIDTLREISVHFRVSADELIYWLLFEMAWQAQLPNVCRVVWTYACLNNLASYRMMMMILRSLWKHSNDSPGDVWGYEAGKFIAGIAFGPTRRNIFTLAQSGPDPTLTNITNQPDHSDPAMTDLFPRNSAHTFHPTPDDGVEVKPSLYGTDTAPSTLSESDCRTSRVLLARQVITEDLEVGLRLKPVFGLYTTLCHAYARDMEMEQVALESPRRRSLKQRLKPGRFMVPLEERAVEQSKNEMRRGARGTWDWG